jgi:hypothetical protein
LVLKKSEPKGLVLQKKSLGLGLKKSEPVGLGLKKSGPGLRKVYASGP